MQILVGAGYYYILYSCYKMSMGIHLAKGRTIYSYETWKKVQIKKDAI